ncbi:MAG: hypothetical protein ACYCW6_13465 [Candidatus Xenobia bacterium]
MKPRMVLNAPGPWKSVSEVRPAMAPGWEVRLESRSASLVKLFRAEAALSPEDLARVNIHTSVAHVVSRPYSREDAPQMTHQALLLVLSMFAVGASGMRCESSGTIHPWDTWQRLSDSAHLGFLQLKEGDGVAARYTIWEALYDAWVRTPLATPTDYYSCGMHLFSYPDCIVQRAAVPDESTAHDLMRSFALYLMAEFAHIEPGNTFRIEPGAPRFVLVREKDTLHDALDLLHNPYGHWRLQRG